MRFWAVEGWGEKRELTRRSEVRRRRWVGILGGCRLVGCSTLVWSLAKTSKAAPGGAAVHMNLGAASILMEGWVSVEGAIRWGGAHLLSSRARWARNKIIRGLWRVELAEHRVRWVKNVAAGTLSAGWG